MNRRSFFRSIAGAVMGAAAACYQPSSTKVPKVTEEFVLLDATSHDDVGWFDLSDYKQIGEDLHAAHAAFADMTVEIEGIKIEGPTLVRTQCGHVTATIYPGDSAYVHGPRIELVRRNGDPATLTCGCGGKARL